MTAAQKLPRKISPALLPDRENAYVLQDVYERVVHGCRDEIILQWDGGYLLFCADIDTDSLDAEFHEGNLAKSRRHHSIRSTPPWSKYIGKECGWTWLAINQQGYRDGALVSFDGIIPCVLLNVIASTIFVFSIEEPFGPDNHYCSGGSNMAAERETDKWGNGIETEAASINKLLNGQQPWAIQDLFDKLKPEFPTITEGRIRSHIQWLRENHRHCLMENRAGRPFSFRLKSV